MIQLKISAVLTRGDTRKDVFFRADDLPAHKAARERILLRVIGSPDRYGKQTDGMGAATSSTSKIVILSKSERPDCDVDYLFGQVAIDAPAGLHQDFPDGPSRLSRVVASLRGR